jgi:formyl-CoA transferase
VYTAEDIYKDPYFRERGLLIEYEDEVHGSVTGPGVVPKLTSTPGSVRRAARWTLGADNAEVLEGLGVDEAGLERLRDDGIV